MTIIGLADGLVERLVVDVEEPTAVQLPGRDRGCVPLVDKLREKVLRPLTVGDARAYPVLPFDEDPREEENVQEKPRLRLGESEVHHSLYAFGSDAVAQVLLPPQLHHRKSSATRGSNGALAPLPPPRAPRK